ncbi:MAG: alpha/beta hydrolase [Spirochaetales bacterium]|nr:alpha/beta hydrolase [Spirochaetales bacterium]
MFSFIDIDGVKLAYEVLGEGDDVIFLLNGVAMTMAHWKPLIPGWKLCLMPAMRWL